MKSIVTGSSGFIGKNLTQKLLQNNYEVLGVDPNPSLINDSNYFHHQGYSEDIPEEIIERYFTSDTTLFHIGASKHRNEKLNNKEIYYSNIQDLSNLLEIIKKKPVRRIVFTSSLYVYGTQAKSPYSEKSTVTPDTVYGKSKHKGELSIQDFSEKNLIPSTILRLFFIYGPDQKTLNSNYDSLIHKTIKRLKQGKNPIVYGSGNQSMDFVFIDDLINFLYLCSERKTDLKGNYLLNFSSGKKFSVIEIIKLISEIMKVDVKMNFNEADWTNRLSRYGSNDELKKVFDIDSFTNLTDGINKCVKSYE